mmetsp:Transcript_7122/g.10209  ORF Transcript_7122/g.10209 Transcript_7122/m.10209 type:complete len:271 (+) Transcript_7122:128-940(+)
MSSPSCCPETAWDKPTDSIEFEFDSVRYIPKGQSMTIGRYHTPVYFVKPPISDMTTPVNNEDKKAMIIFTDVFGITERMKFISDELARLGKYHVIIPDSFRGKTMDSESDLVTWLRSVPYQPVVSQDIDSCMEYLRKEMEIEGELPVGSVGFCWGGWAIAKSASEGVSWRCAVSPHPSTKIEKFIFDSNEDLMLEKTKMPFLLLPAGDDMENLKPGGNLAALVEEKGGGSILFDEMKHGWVTRGDLNMPHVKRDYMKALHLILKFFADNF